MLKAILVNEEVKLVVEEMVVVGTLATYHQLLEDSCEGMDVPENQWILVQGEIIKFCDDGEMDRVELRN